MIELETRLLEILDWDEERAEQLYAAAAAFVSTNKFHDMRTLERAMIQHLRYLAPDEACKIVFQILDQSMRVEMRTIEE